MTEQHFIILVCVCYNLHFRHWVEGGCSEEQLHVWVQFTCLLLAAWMYVTTTTCPVGPWLSGGSGFFFSQALSWQALVSAVVEAGLLWAGPEAVVSMMKGGQEPELTHRGACAPGQARAFSGPRQPTEDKHSGQQQRAGEAGAHHSAAWHLLPAARLEQAPRGQQSSRPEAASLSHLKLSWRIRRWERGASDPGRRPHGGHTGDTLTFTRSDA